MKANRFAVVVCIILATVSVPALAQQPATAPSEGALNRIPAGTLAYVVANDLKGSSAAIQKLLTDMSMNAMVKPVIGDDMLATAIKCLNLGEGLDTTGGVAMAIMDGKEFGADVGEMVFTLLDRGRGAQFSDWPLLILVPGKDIKTVFAQFKMQADGDFMKIQIAGEDIQVYATQKDGYIFISPMSKVLTSALAAKKSAADELDKDHVALMGQSIVAVHIDLAKCGPIVNGWIKKGQDSISEGLKRYQAEMANGQNNNNSMPVDMYPRIIASMQQAMEMLGVVKDLYAQLGQVSLGVRTVKSGAVVDALLTFADGSASAKEVQAAKALDKPLGLLPALDYGVALSTNNSPLTVLFTMGMGMTLPRGMNTEISKLVLGSFGIRGAMSVSGEDNAIVGKVTALAEQFEHEVLATHLYAGAAPDKSGILGAALILECKDGDRFKTVLAGACATVSEFFDKVTQGQFKLEYKKAAAEGDPDMIEAVIADLGRMQEQGHKAMNAIVGEDKIRFMVGSPAKNIIVLSFGGKKAMFDEAMKSAKDGGPIGKDKEIVKGMEYMPKNLQTLLVVNGAQVFDLIAASVKAGGDNSQPPFAITAKTPLMIGVGTTGSSNHITIFMPADLLRDSVNMFMGIFASYSIEERPVQQPNGQAQPAPTQPVKPNMVDVEKRVD